MQRTGIPTARLKSSTPPPISNVWLPYNDLLKRTIEALRAGKKINLNQPLQNEIQINTGLACIIPQSYLPDVHERLVLYKRIANAQNNDELKDLQIEIIDRFGTLPEPLKNLLAATKLKLFAEKIGIEKISLFEDKAVLNFANKTKIEPLTIINLIQKQAAIYQLKGQSQLIIKQQMADGIARIEWAHEQLKMLLE
ncbi:MAG: hypothetical protein HAW58_02025 [Candidatus Thioglobus sp.]|nr:hypothetical protein [Candidatus Thioglobus sp.]